LQYKRARYYDPTTGRFVSEDPLGLAGGLNLYGFANGDPVNFSAPFGLRPCPPDNDCGPPTAEQEALQNPGLADPVAWVSGFLAGGLVGGASASAGGGIIQSAKIMGQAFSMLRSGGMAELRAAAEAGVSASVKIGGRNITFDPGPFSGMTNFAENTFHLGSNAFTSNVELTKTVLHELFRLSNSSGGIASAASAAAQTRAAASFAERAYTWGSRLGIWR
jgi:hypothetical protein